MRIFIYITLTMASVLGVAGCGRRPDSESSSGQTPATPPWFEDATDRSGIRFTHGAGTNYDMPDAIGSGAALLDADNDGRLDIYFVQNNPGRGFRNQLYLQQSDGTFRNASEGSGVDVVGRGMGAIAGDVNNDGLADLVVTEYGAVRLFLNIGGGRFREVTWEAGLDNPRWACAASFIDYDRDGRLDLVIGNYIDYDPTQACKDTKGAQDFCNPSAFAPATARLWRNRTESKGGSPVFEDQTGPSGLARVPGAALGLICADFDGDGWPDIFFADDGRPNRLFINRRNGQFEEEAAMRGLAFNAMGKTAGNMGVIYADFDGDGLGDVFVTHLTEEFHSLFRQDVRGLFLDVISQSGLQQQGWRGTGFGAVAADFDGDGWPDIALTSGLVGRASPGQTPVLDGVHPWWARYAQRSQLFANRGGGKFQDISNNNPAFAGKAMVGRSLAIGDLDNDGWPDLVVASIGGPARIYHNIAARNGHWLKVRVVEPSAGGRDAIGAEVVVRAGPRKWWAVVQPAASYLASNDPVLHFGLGPASAVDEVQVRWPDGTVETFAGIAADKSIRLEKGDSRK